MTVPSEYLRPTDLTDALRAAASGGYRVAAGCTDLFPATERKHLPGPVLDITALSELRGITQTPDGLRIGALTTWSDIVHADLPAACQGLQQAAREVGAVQIQNRGTVGGNLCNASPAADGVPPLLTLAAEVELASAAGTRRMALTEFLQGPRRTALKDGELLSAIHVPKTALTGRSVFHKLGARRYLVISVAMVAVRIKAEQGRITDAALAVGACGPVASRLHAAEDMLIGQSLSQALRIDAGQVAAEVSPIDDIRADARYRTQAATELLQRCLTQLITQEMAS